VCLLDISQATGADWLVSVWTPFTYWSYFTHPFPVYWLSYPRNIIPPDHLLSSIHIKETVCTYLCTYMSLFHMQTTRPTYTKFCTDLHTNSGRFLTQVWPCRPNSLTLWYPKLQNLNRSQKKKTLLFKKCPDWWLNLSKFFPGSAQLQLASLI